MRKALMFFGFVLIGLAVAILLVGLHGSETIPYKVHEVPKGIDSNKEEAVDIDWASLPEGVVAWVRVPGTTIDYPVVQEDAAHLLFYLDHDMNGDYSVWGTPYIDAGCADGSESPLVIIYGHHMSDGTMFASFAQYSDAAFAEEHQALYVYTQSRTYELQVFAVDVLDASVEGKQTDIADSNELQSYLDDSLLRCEVVLSEPQDINQAWAFVTCSYETDNSRTVVYAAGMDAN